MFRYLHLFLLAVLTASLISSATVLPLPVYRAVDSVGVDIDAVGVPTKIVDGDTLYVRIVKFYDRGIESVIGAPPIEVKVRLADIDAPEIYTDEGREAAEALEELVSGRTLYLDIDDMYVYGKYRRVIAVLYIDYNRTHLLNVNEWLVEHGYVVVKDYPNEFNPYEWSLYVVRTANVSTSSASSAPPSTTTRTVTVTRTTFVTVTKTVTLTKTVTVIASRTITSAATVTKTVTTTVTSTLPETNASTETTISVEEYRSRVEELIDRVLNETLDLIERALAQAYAYIEEGDADRALRVVNEALDLLPKVLQLFEKKLGITTVSTVTVTKTVTVAPYPQRVPAVLRSINSTFAFGDILLRVVRVVEARCINVSGVYYIPYEGMKIVAVVLEVENPSNRTHTVPTFPIFTADLVTNTSRVYREASTVLRCVLHPSPEIAREAVTVPSLLTPDKLRPGESAEYTLVYQVPEDERPELLLVRMLDPVLGELVILVSLA